MTDAPKKSDPDNVFVTAGVKDPAKAYVFVPFNYRDAQAAIKEAGGKWAGSQWELTADALKSAEADIRAAARKDIELGAEGRKTREDGLKAEKGEAKPEKTAEEIEAAKADRAAAARDRAIEADKTRVPVLSGSVAEGGTVSVGGNDVAVTKVGAEVELDDAAAARYAERFPDTSFKAGDKVSFAYFEAPEPEKDDTPEPGM
jgi:hypothetical protein